MQCQDCQESFSLYLDGELDQTSRSEVDAHFAICPQCRMEWQAFRNSIELLRGMPMASVPPGFLAGIHRKLEPRSPWQKVTEFLTGGGEKKWAASSALAMLVIGFAAASLMQLLPVSRTDLGSGPQATLQSGRLAENSSGTEQSPLPEANRGGRQDFYPGVPLLSEYEGKDSSATPQLAMIPRSKPEQHIPVVDFVSTGADHSSSPYLDAPLSSFSARQQAPAIKPDLQITIHAAPRAEQMAMVQQIIQSPLWRTELHNHNTLLLSVPASSFEQLLQICGSEKTSLSPEYARNSHYISPKRFLTVAVKLD